MSNPTSKRTIKDIVIHCAASKTGEHITVDIIDGWHAARGFARQPAAREKFNKGLKSIGYHWVIYLDGSIVPGRHEDEIGAHVAGSNARSIGVCLVGTDRFTEAQWASLATLVAELGGRYPNAQVKGHRDFSPDLNGDGIIQPWEYTKLCPGFSVAAWLARGMTPAQENLR